MIKSMKEIAPSVTPTAPNIKKPEKELVQEKLKEIIEKDKRLVRGTFVYEEFPGSAFTFKNTKYKDVSCNITMVDGYEYEIPKWLADFINGKDDSKDAFNPDADRTTNTCAVPTNFYRVDKGDFPKQELQEGLVPMIGQKYKKKMRFIPLSFGE